MNTRFCWSKMRNQSSQEISSNDGSRPPLLGPLTKSIRNKPSVTFTLVGMPPCSSTQRRISSWPLAATALVAIVVLQSRANLGSGSVRGTRREARRALRSPWLVLLAAFAVLAALALLHTLVWGWVYRVRPSQDELRFSRTQDGWRVAVAPRVQPRWPPVLLCHGLSANRASLDFGVPRYSLALALANAGFDCFALDLRGHGDSRRGSPRAWSF